MASYRRFRPRLAAAPIETAAFERPALPGTVVDAVLRFHDQAEEQGSGRTLLRLSEKRLRQPEVRKRWASWPPAPPTSRSSGTRTRARSCACSRPPDGGFQDSPITFRYSTRARRLWSRTSSLSAGAQNG